MRGGIGPLLIALCLLGSLALLDGGVRAAGADEGPRVPPPPPPPRVLPPAQPRGPVTPPRPGVRAPRGTPRPAAPRGGVPPPPPPPSWTPETRARPRAVAPRQPVPRQPAPVRPDTRLPDPGPPSRPPPGPGQPLPARPQPGSPDEPEGSATDDLAAARPVVRQIVFEGNLLYGTEMIKARLQTEEGRRLDPAKLDADMKELYRYFREIQVVMDKVAGGIILRFRVAENPLVARLDVRGNEEVEDVEIREMIRTQEGFPLSPYHLATDREDVAEAYRLRGFHFAQVPEPEVIILANGGRHVVFTVVEGPQVQVERIIIRGNANVPRKDLLEVMLTDEPSFFERIAGGNTFREDMLREDLVALKELYRFEGFLDAEVALDDMRFSDDKQRVEITIAITEHQPFTVGDIKLTINREELGTFGCATQADLDYFTEDRIRQLFALRSGERYSGKKAKEGIEAIQEAYFARSFLELQIVDPVLRSPGRDLVVDLSITINEGRKYRLQRIDFFGNEYTRDKILRRDVHTAPGGYVDRNELDKGLTRIRRLNYFDRATLRIDDALDVNGDALDGWKRATYELVEGSTGRVSFGVQLSTNGGFGATVQFTKRNFDIARWPSSWEDLTSGRAFTGAGQELDILLAPSTTVSQGRVRFREPRFFGTDFSFDATVFKSFEFRRSYITDRTGYTLGFGYPVFRAKDDRSALWANASWRHEGLEIRDIDSDAIPGAFLFADFAELRSISGSLSYATVDDFEKPRWETTTSLKTELAGTFLGGDIDMWSVTGSHTQTWVVHEDNEGKKHRIALRFQGGVQEALEDTPETPPYERFYSGGNSFRGFRFRGVGPHVNGLPTGGEFYATVSAEYEFPIVKDVFSVVAFVDQGTVEDRLKSPEDMKWRIAVGGGIRFAIPMLGDRPLALDFGFPLLFEDEDERTVVSFTLGRNF